MGSDGGWYMQSPAGAVLERSTRRRRALSWLRRGGFRMVELNAVGWAALAGPGAAVGVIAWGVLVGSWWPGALVGALVGALFAWLVALIVDARHHARSHVGFQLGEHVTAEEAAGIVARLKAQGIDVWLEPTIVASEHTASGVPGFNLVGTQRDAATIADALGPPSA